MSSRACHYVSSNIVFGRGLRCCGAPLLCSARRLLPYSCCHMASFQRCTGKPERDGDTERDMVRPGKLFYIIPRHNRANPNVRARTRSNREESVFFQGSDFLGISLHIDSMERVGRGSSRWFQVHMSWRSKPCRAIIIMNSGGATLHPRHSEKQAQRSFCMLHACRRQQHRRTFIQK